MKAVREYKTKNVIFRGIVVVVYLALFIAVAALMRYVQGLLNSDVKINLMEVVTQNRDVITSKLELEANSLNSTAERLKDRMKKEENTDRHSLQKVFVEYSEDNDVENIFVSDLDGNAVFSDGNEVDISGRTYFKLAVQGIDNISDRIMSRESGEDIFVFSVPLIAQGETIGTIQKYFTPEEMYALCAVSLYSDNGYMYIINREGYILISSKRDEYSRETENYFRMLYSQGNQEASKQLQNDIGSEKEGFMETELFGERTFSAYTPIQNIHDWYLISSVATSSVSSNASTVIRMFYFILCVVILILGGNLWAFLKYKDKQQENLKRIAFVDGVTGGNTYNKFVVDLHSILEAGGDKPHYLIKFDIDNFKYVNNFYGFDAGDRILSQIYQTVNGKLHEGETVARISGDNFVMLLDNIEEERLNNILEAAQKDEEVMISLSVGAYTILDPEESVSLMVDKAGVAAAVVKGNLQKQVCYYSEEFDEQMIKSEQTKRAVKAALDNDEMIPFYQPKVDVNTGRMVGAEALARWMTPDGKLIPPNNFIPMCEKTGLVTELDMCIFEKVLKFQRKRIDAGLECVPISVNFSRLHLRDEDFVSKVVAKMKQYHVPPKFIEMELTESAIFDNYKVISEFIEKLHEIGFLISMDDFGSGYSSLNMLKDITIDVLKIDKAFLDKTLDNSRQLIIFGAIANMAQQLDIMVVVEGVETSEHVELMKEVGCSIAQGYYYSKPVDEKTFETICQEGIK